MTITLFTRALLPALMLLVCAAPRAQTALSLDEAIMRARMQDPWLHSSQLREQALAARSQAAGYLPDPTISLGMANLPIDSMDFNQEAMTQLSMGISQMLPRGDTLALEKERLGTLSREQPSLRAERVRSLELAVTQRWLDAWLAQHNMQMLEDNRALFDSLVELADARYRSGAGLTRQQDMVAAQVELTRLEDRLSQLADMRETQRIRLGEWVGPGTIPAEDLPSISPHRPPAALQDPTLLATVLSAHPSVCAADSRIAAAQSGVDIARQAYKPQWGLSAGYGYRDEDAFGRHRDDFLSLGVSVSMPLFGSARQDHQVQAARADVEALRTDRALTLRSLQTGLSAANSRLLKAEERITLYRTRLLPQLEQQSASVLSAYHNDLGSFRDVVRARIAELDARLELQGLDVARLKTIAELNYHLSTEPCTEEAL